KQRHIHYQLAQIDIRSPIIFVVGSHSNYPSTNFANNTKLFGFRNKLISQRKTRSG
ncbi:MAG: hypothetical protein ACI92E_002993, partial [Oceanicoccus sp.]